MADVLRYYLTTILPETKDSEFTWKGFQDANNSELVSIFGNFVNRTFVLMHKLCGGKVPPLHADIIDEKDRTLMADIGTVKEKVEELIEQYKFRDALFEIIDLSRKGNRYMQEKEPWILAKKLADDGLAQKQIDNCLHLCLQLTANLAILVNPFLPHTARKLLHMMKVVERMLEWENAGKIKLLSVGYTLRAPELLFRKIEDQEIAYQKEKLKMNSQQKQGTSSDLPSQVSDSSSPQSGSSSDQKAPESPVKPVIQFDDFAKIDLKTGTILSAEKVEKADKLLKLEVDLGFEKRTIVSGIALHFKPEELVSKQVVVVANLAPRKMRGIESNGMLLLAQDKDGKLVFVSPEQVITAGSGVS